MQTITTATTTAKIATNAIQTAIAFDKKANQFVEDVIDPITANLTELTRIGKLLTLSAWDVANFFWNKNGDWAIAGLETLTENIKSNRKAYLQFARSTAQFWVLFLVVTDNLLNLAFQTEYETTEIKSVQSAIATVLKEQRLKEVQTHLGIKFAEINHAMSKDLFTPLAATPQNRTVAQVPQNIGPNLIKVWARSLPELQNLSQVS